MTPSRLGRPAAAGDARSSSLGLLIWAVFAALLIFLAWARWAELPQVTRAPAVVISSLRTQVIQSQDGGTIEELRVKEGDVVERGELLVRLERTRAQSAYLETRGKVASLKAAAARLHAEISGGEPAFPPEVEEYPEFRANQRMLFKARRGAIEQEVAALQSLLVLAQKELAITAPLLKTGDVSQTDVLRLERQVVDLNAQITNKRNKYLQDTQAELSKVQEDLAALTQTLRQRQDQLQQTELAAPVRGVVKNVRITTRGGVVRPGEEVMQIVPLEDDLVVEARVTPADIAFLRPGLPARVKLDAYDYTVYGDVAGRVVYISADTISDGLRQDERPYYRVQVRAEGRRFSAHGSSALEVQPGMTSMVEIRTGQRTVLQYLLKPLVKTLDESLGER